MTACGQVLTHGALTGTGLVLAWRILTSWENVVGSTYGRILLVKLAVVLVNKSPRAAPASAAEGRPAVQTAALGDLEVRATMTPGVQGRNTIRFRIEDSAGAPAALARLPTVSIRSDDLDLGTVPVTRAGTGTCTADVVIPAAGRVEVQVGMRRSQFENPVATLSYRIPSS